MAWRHIVLVLCLVLGTGAAARAGGPFMLQPFRVLLGGDLGGLEALLVRPSDPGRYPLAMLAHGSPRSGADRVAMTPLAMLPQALEFARRGWAAAVVMRRGYGNSDGGWAETYGSCDNPNYIAAASRRSRRSQAGARLHLAPARHRSIAHDRRRGFGRWLCHRRAHRRSAAGSRRRHQLRRRPRFAAGRSGLPAGSLDRSVSHLRKAVAAAHAVGLCRERSLFRPGAGEAVRRRVHGRRRPR